MIIIVFVLQLVLILELMINKLKTIIKIYDAMSKKNLCIKLLYIKLHVVF